MFQLGPFEVEEHVGAGAMGQVWRGIHARTRTPVAVKFVTPTNTELQVAEESVRLEARAIAGLHHPNVVHVYDQGVVGPRTADVLTGVAEGSPYIVMELLSGGTLSERHGTTSWARLGQDLERILEALAHCHACGVLHRDLKPSNVLFGAPSDPRPGLKLVDFGIAWSDRSAGRASMATPEYGSPEQLGNEAHAQGPWSDIYAVGALAWKLITGRSPWQDLAGPAALFIAKAEGKLPLFEPRFDVPEALEDWLGRAMAGPPGDRFQSAPDALHALLGVGGETKGGSYRELRAESGITRGVSEVGRLSARIRGAPPPAPLVRELMEVPIPPPALRDAGLGLWMYRRPQFTGRMPQRVRLWQRLEHSFRDNEPRVVGLRGPPGSGRTRTGQWLLEAARSNGGVFAAMVSGSTACALDDLLDEILRFRAPGVPRDHVDWMLEHHGISWRAATEAVERWLSAHELGKATGELRIEALVQVVLGLARLRPVLLVLDDVDHDPDLLELARALGTSKACPLLTVCTSSTVLPGIDEVPGLDPLRRRELGQLIDSVLPLDASSSSDLVDGSAGLPGEAMRLVREAFREGRFSHGLAGLELRFEDGTLANLPEMSNAVREILERSGLLGVFPDVRVVTASFGNQRHAQRAVDITEQQGWITVEHHVMRFRSGVRAAVVGQIPPARARRHHLALGRTLPPESAQGALHRIEAGEVDEGFGQLVQALQLMEQGSDLYALLEMSDRGLDLWRAQHGGNDAAAWTSMVLRRASYLAGVRSPRLMGEIEQDLAIAQRHAVWDAVAGLLVERAAAGARQADRDLHYALEVARSVAMRGRAFHGLARHAERSFEVGSARYWLRQAANLVDSEDREAAGDARVARARLLAMDEDYIASARELEAASRLKRSEPELELLAAGVQLAAGNLVPARSHLLRCVHQLTLRRDRQWLPIALVRLGLVELLEGSLDQAEAKLAEADRILGENQRRYRADPSLGAPVRLLLNLERGEWRRAVETLGHLTRTAWKRPARVAVHRRLVELLATRGPDMPDEVREVLRLTLKNFDGLTAAWIPAPGH